jgi:hypothetical protein
LNCLLPSSDYFDPLFKSALKAMTEHDKRWNMQYEKLVELKRKTGHCMVPQSYEQDKSLGKWVSTQRTINYNNTIRLDRKGLLDEIGFAWKAERSPVNDKIWHQHYEKLVEFKRKNGHCMVPRKHEQSLGQWVATQRHFHNNNKNKLRQDRKELLDKIGFAWKDDGANNDKLWHQQHEKLVEFKRKNGNCLVPQRYEADKSLGSWVKKQRKLHNNNNKLRQDRKRILDIIGFVWKAVALAARSSTKNVRNLVIGSFHALGRSCCSLLFFFRLFVCSKRIRKPAHTKN